MTIIFLDTNIFLHFTSFVEIDWLKICQDRECKIVIAPVVIDELDKYKVKNDDKGKRARKALKKIEECVDSNSFEISKNVELEVIPKRPQRSTFKVHQLDPEEQDNQLIASIIEYQSHIDEKNISLCSNDIGPRLRSKPFGINIIKLPESYLLPEKDDAVEKQLKGLLKENALLKSRIPKPLLQFENGKDYIEIQIVKNEIDKVTYVKNGMLDIKSRYTNMSFEDKSKSYNPLATFASLSLITKEQIERYNMNLNEFYLNYEDYLQSMSEYEMKSSLSIKIELFLANEGNVPAEDVDIYCHFPDGFELIEEDEFEDPPEEPNPPSTPKTFYENIGNFNFRPYIPNIGAQTMPKLNKPNIKKTNSYDVDFFRKSAKHYTIYPLDVLFAAYDKYSEMNNFHIDYKIVAGNVPEPVTGRLNIIFDK